MRQNETVRSMLSLAAAAIVLAPLAASAADARLTPELAAELNELVTRGRCGTLLERAGELENKFPDDPDLLTLQGNCLLMRSRRTTETFAPDRVEDLRIARGRQLTREEVSQLGYVRAIEHGADDLVAAERKFRRALEVEPERPDLVLGNVALLVNSGRVGPAVELLREHGASLDTAARNDAGKLVEDLLRRGRFDDAERLARGIRDALPTSANGHVALALVASTRGRALESLELLESAHDVEPRRATVTRELVAAQLLARRYTVAIETLVPIATSSVEYQAWLGLAREAAAPGSSARIWQSLTERIGTAAALDAESKQVIDYYRRLLKQKTAPSAVMRLRAAGSFLDSGLAIPALVEAHSALRVDPALTEAHALIANIYRESGAFDLALEALDEGLSALAASGAPATDAAYGPGELNVARARALVGLGRFEDALGAYREAARLGAGAPDELAHAAIRAGKRDEAVATLRELVAAGGFTAEWAAARLERLGEPVEAP